VSLRVKGGRVSDAHAYVGGRWRPAQGQTTDLGTVSAPQAASDLLTLAERADGDADGLVTAATLADSAVVWPALLRLARREDVALETRRQGVFWLGQAAGDAATRGLDSITADEGATSRCGSRRCLHLSQRPADEGVPALIRAARTNPNGEIRKSALFWLTERPASARAVRGSPPVGPPSAAMSRRPPLHYIPRMRALPRRSWPFCCFGCGEKPRRRQS
jgi:hypothetical protein